MYRNHWETNDNCNKSLCYTETEKDKQIIEKLWENALISTHSSGCPLHIGVVIGVTTPKYVQQEDTRQLSEFLLQHSLINYTHAHTLNNKQVQYLVTLARATEVENAWQICFLAIKCKQVLVSLFTFSTSFRITWIVLTGSLKVVFACWLPQLMVAFIFDVTQKTLCDYTLIITSQYQLWKAQFEKNFQLYSSITRSSCVVFPMSSIHFMDVQNIWL